MSAEDLVSAGLHCAACSMQTVTLQYPETMQYPEPLIVLFQAATGKDVRAVDLGRAELHCTTSGIQTKPTKNPSTRRLKAVFTQAATSKV